MEYGGGDDGHLETLKGGGGRLNKLIRIIASMPGWVIHDSLSRDDSDNGRVDVVNDSCT